MAASVATASHPNSPQNFSQGSSDATIFMTHQSQSPPNSLPAQPTQQRLVNGPTTFKNLIPKGTRSAITSPSIPPQQQLFYNNNNNNNKNNNSKSHIHQNGGVFESSSSSMPPTSVNLLGKRKFEGNGNNDIDENSNHSRKKMLKKSTGIAFGQISSPNIPPVNVTNIINNNNNNNSYAVNNLKPVPVLQLQTLQKQPTPPLPPQSQATSIIPPLQETLLEAPKKRGRRKGSKGIDSNLNGSAIPTDFTTEIQQKIALSAGKRNKTTFELQQMLLDSHHQNSTASLPLANGDVLDSCSIDRG